MCFPISSLFGSKNDYGVTSKDPNYHRPLSTTSSGNSSYQGVTTTSPVVPAATTDAYGGRAAYQQGKPLYPSSYYAPAADESAAKPLAIGWSNSKVAHHA